MANSKKGRNETLTSDLSYTVNREYENLRAKVTPEWAYLKRRRFMGASLAGLMSLWVARNARAFDLGEWFKEKWSGEPSKEGRPTAVKTDQALSFKETAYKVSDRKLTEEKYALHYNNFYEFSLDKEEVSERAEDWRVTDWKVEVSGLVKKPMSLNLSDIYRRFPLEERVYRFRCVEAWSMVLPWIGFPLSDLVKAVQPEKECEYVKFTSYEDPKIMPNINGLPSYPWPYTEGLTLAEARHPLALIAVGLYGKKLAPQNGAPLRLVVPWKYGFKSIKSLVKIEFVKDRPKTLWNTLASDEYGFYANVNPEVSHPRWSQASERVINGSFLPTRIPTLKFNGYEKDVAGLYAGLDLKKNY